MLIGSIGDVVSAFVGWYTVWLGKNAHDFWKLFVALVTMKSKEKIRHAVREAKDDDYVVDEGSGLKDIADIERRVTTPWNVQTNSLSDLQIELAEEKYRPFVMLKAMQKIMEHLDESPPRKYTFEEWSWLLKLLGEDEADAEGHRRVGTPVRDGAEVITPLRTGKNQVWSWLGQESPLMSVEDNSEPKWVLKRLMSVLDDDLKGRAERHVKRDVGPIIQEEDSEKIQ